MVAVAKSIPTSPRRKFNYSAWNVHLVYGDCADPAAPHDPTTYEANGAVAISSNNARRYLASRHCMRVAADHEYHVICGWQTVLETRMVKSASNSSFAGSSSRRTISCSLFQQTKVPLKKSCQSSTAYRAPKRSRPTWGRSVSEPAWLPPHSPMPPKIVPSHASFPARLTMGP